MNDNLIVTGKRLMTLTAILQYDSSKLPIPKKEIKELKKVIVIEKLFLF